MTRKLAATLVLILASFVAIAGFDWPPAQPQTLLKVAPQMLKAQIGEQTTVDLVVEKVSALYKAQLHIRFDPEVLEVIDADPALEGIQVEPGTLPAPDYIVQNRANNQIGTIDYALTQLPPRKPGEGDGVIARITFRAKKAALSQILLDQFLLADTEGSSIQAVPQHGQIRVMGNSIWMFAVAAGVAALLLIGGSVGFAVTRGS